MTGCEFERFTYSSHGVFCNIGYPRTDGNEKINSFYLSYVEAWKKFCEKTAGRKLILKITPNMRYLGEKRLYLTFDVLISLDGELKYYARHAHGWDIKNSRFLGCGRGEDTFFDGENYVRIKNLFGKTKCRRMSDYIVEEKISRR